MLSRAARLTVTPRLDAWRALVLLAVYTLFVLVPGVHLMVHDHVQPSASADHAVATTGPACGDNCCDPSHHHHQPSVDQNCTICVQSRWLAHGEPRPMLVVLAHTPAQYWLEPTRAPLLAAPLLGLGARGPPVPLAS